MDTRKQIQFDVFTLDTADETLRKGAERIHLRPKTYALLLHLASRPGKLAVKDELLNAVWRDCNVGEEALKHCILEIRRALGDDAEKPRFIETVHRRGYRFIGIAVAARNPGMESRAKKPEADPDNPPLPEAGPFVERNNELARLQRVFEETADGSRRIVLISGEQGTGKSRLVDAFLERIAGSKLPPVAGSSKASPWISRGQCLRSHGPTEDYMPLMEALTGLCRMPEGRRITNTLCRYAPLWMSRMPSRLSAEQILRIRISTRNATPERMLRELAEALEELTSKRPMVLVLEDLQWSDPSTLDWLLYWAQRREPSRLLLLATYRPEEAADKTHLLNGIRRELDAKPLCHELSLDSKGE